MTFVQPTAIRFNAGVLTLRLALFNGLAIGMLFVGGAFIFEILEPSGTDAPSSVWQAVGQGLLLPLVGWCWVFCVFMFCGASAFFSHKLFAERSRRDEYAAHVAPVVQRWLLGAGCVAAAAMATLAVAAQFWPLEEGVSGVVVIGMWIFLSAIVPVECGATVLKRKEAVIRAALIPWAFVLLYPMHMGDRVGGSRNLAIIAGALMVAMMFAFAMFLLATEQL
ncbi:MAG: hypothetical protein WD875_01230 [Pirellulales bacterium]